MSLRSSRTLLIGAGICSVLLLAESAVLVVKAVQLSKARKTLGREQGRLTKLLNRDPYPSVANVKILAKNLDELEYRVGELASELSRDPFPQDAIEAAEFSARAQDVIERFRGRAERAGMQLPESLEVGFAQYASGGAVPQAAHVPRLSRQLYSVERVADVLVESGVTSVDGMSRDTFEDVSEAEAPRRRPRNLPASKGRKSLLLTASESGPDSLYYIERVGVSFTAKEEVVWRVLNLFAASSHFMVVSEFSHQTQSGILGYNPDSVKLGGASDDETLRFLSEGILSGEKALSRPERIIAGDELIAVHLTIDVYNFDPQEAGQ